MVKKCGKKTGYNDPMHLSAGKSTETPVSRPRKHLKTLNLIFHTAVLV